MTALKSGHALGAIVIAAGLASGGAAVADGNVSVYTAHKAEIIERLVPEFEAASGIRVDIVKAGSGDIINRVRAESANPLADVIWSIGSELLEANAELLEPYQPAGYDMVDPAFKSDSGWIPYTAILNVFIVNTDKLAEGDYPKTWLDLADERFAGQISSARADKSGSSYMQLATFLKIYGDDDAGWDKYNSIFTNFALSDSSGAVPRFVNDGEASVGITLEDNAFQYVRGGGPVAIIYPEDGTSTMADGMALVKGAPNPDNAKVFLDWAMSKETQELVVQEIGRRPIRTDVAPSGALPPLGDIKLIDYNIIWAANNRDNFRDHWNELFLDR